jgi:hypothetical protein
MLAPNPSQHLESEIPIAGNPPYRFNLPESCSSAVGGELSLVQLDQVFGLASGAIKRLVDMFG